MRYEDIEGYDEYKEMLEEKVKGLDHIRPNRAYAVFIDGKDATKPHNKDIMADKGYSYHMLHSARMMLNKYDVECHMFSIMDEISLLFPYGKDLIEVFREDTEDGVLSIIILEFMGIFSLYEYGLVKGVCYPIKRADIPKIIDYRRWCGRASALEYYAKEYLPSCKYKNKTEKELLDELKVRGLYDDFMKMHDFVSGFEYERKKNDIYIPENTAAEITGYEFED